VADLLSVLPKIANIPTMLVWGSRDRAVYPESATLLQQQFTNARLVMFDGVGHQPYEEVPEAFNVAVQDFLLAHQSCSLQVPCGADQMFR
jgi:pimeloyl-ACP methyl ester carboxylesterase